MASPVLDITDLACRRGGRPVFDRLSFGLGAGELLALTGRNGSGKTTLLRALALLVRPDAGTIRWQGADIRAEPEAWRGRLAWLGHLEGLKGDLSVRENLWPPSGCAARRRRRIAWTAPWWPSISPAWRRGPCAACRPGSAGGWRWRG